MNNINYDEKQRRADKIEEKGSRSPDKKRRIMQIGSNSSGASLPKNLTSFANQNVVNVS